MTLPLDSTILLWINFMATLTSKTNAGVGKNVAVISTFLKNLVDFCNKYLVIT